MPLKNKTTIINNNTLRSVESNLKDKFSENI